MKLSLVIAFSLFAAGVLRAGPIYLLGVVGDDTSDSYANSINGSNLVVGHCAPEGDDFGPCYWDLNEQPFLFTSTNPGMVSAYVLNPHILPYIGCAVASSEISDIDDSDQILGHAITTEDIEGCTDYVTGQLPDFTSWTPLADISLWTHVPTLANSNWAVTNGDNVFGSSQFMAHVDAVPEPSNLFLLGALLGAFQVYRSRRALRK